MEPTAELDRLAERVIGAAIEVHRHLGPGYVESVYEAASQVELDLRAIEYRRQYPIGLHYKGRPVGEGRLDFLMDGKLIVELKSVGRLMPVHKAQVISYLKTTGLWLGLLINFNVPVLRSGIQRIIHSQ